MTALAAIQETPGLHEYLEELDRGLDFREDLLLPGSFELEVAPGRSQILAATVEAASTIDLDALGSLFGPAGPRASRPC